ncbi:restriction endonuclease subunit S [Nocardia araoensis]|uniref:restriction endonuclease subunit S n=1 Tax=Nocardia araoensis TaxID=228600 RepID=UPI0012F6C172|nr:restriction endonuclease subunit S [Nocardia araoensis]
MNWPIVALGEVADTALGKMLDNGKSQGLPHVPYLRNINVQWGRIDTSDLLTMEMADEERERFAVEEGDLLVCEGGEVGRCAIWHGRTEYLAYQKALHRVRPSAALDTRYLRYLLEYYSRNGTLASLSTGSAIAHLPQQKLRQVPVPLPSLAEQYRIVQVLEDYLSHIDAGCGYLATAASRTERLHERLLSSALEDISFSLCPLAGLLTVPLANGRSVPSLEGGFPVLRLTALQGDRIDLSERKDGAWTQNEAQRWLVQRGDFLISRGNGSLRLVGRGGLVDQTPDPVAFPDTLVRARPDVSKISAEYLALVWNSPMVRKQIENIARTTAGIFKVNQRDLGAVQLPLPSMGDQVALVKRVYGLRVAVARLDRHRKTAIAHADALRHALLTAAFSGRLSGHNSDFAAAAELILA